MKKMKEKRGESNTPQIVYSATAYRVDAGYRVDFFRNQIILGISIVQVVCIKGSKSWI